ncbi:MAG: hypothetical protein NDF51_05405 [archaeon YNP-WB-040]|nr:hypothetical protein [Candidatus Culexarchaeum yellowstonense]
MSVGLNFQPKGKSPKFQQIIWLDAETYQWIIGLSASKGLAPNVLIAQLLRAVYEAQQSGKIQPVVTIEKPIKIYRCPFCEFETQKLADIIDHISDKHKDKLRELAL